MVRGDKVKVVTANGVIEGVFGGVEEDDDSPLLGFWLFDVPNNSATMDTHPVFVNPDAAVTVIPKS